MTDFTADSIRRHQAHTQNAHDAYRAAELSGDARARLRALSDMLDARSPTSLATHSPEYGSVKVVDIGDYRRRQVK